MGKFNKLCEDILNEGNWDLSNLPEKYYTPLKVYYHDVEEKLKFLLRHLEEVNLKKESDTVKKMQKLLVSTKIKESGKFRDE